MNLNDLFTSEETREEELAAALASYSNTTQTLLTKYLTGVPEDHKGLLTALTMTRDEALALELLAIYPHCNYETGPAINKAHYLIGIVRGLHHYPQYQNTRLDQLTGDNLHKATSLINITSVILRHYETPPLSITNPDDPHTSNIHFQNNTVANLITKHHYRTADLIEFLSNKSMQLAERAFAGLPHLRWYQKQSLDNITDHTVDTALNYLRVTEALQMNTDNADLTRVRNKNQTTTGSYIDNPELELFIEQNPTAIEDFIDYIDERWNADLKGFHDYMSNGTALKEGVL